MKELASMIVGKIKPKEQPQEVEAAPEEMELSGLDTAVDELMAALEAKDKVAVKEALKNAIYFCKEEE